MSARGYGDLTSLPGVTKGLGRPPACICWTCHTGGECARVNQARWDNDFLALATFWAVRKSKDPSTRCGAVIARGKEIVCLGYNGFARGVRDLPERYDDRGLKYQLVVHAELNAITIARQPLDGCTLYTWPFQPCSRCAAVVINARIARVVAPVLPEDKRERWGEDMALAAMQFREAGVSLELVDGVW